MVLMKPGMIMAKEMPKPSIRDDEVLVEVKSVSICGSDIEYYEAGRIGEFVVKEPLILGHESAGLVTEVGKGVDNLKVGDRVAVEPVVGCRKCKYCKTGHYNICPDRTILATPPTNGAFVEYLAHPADHVFKLPDSISYDEGALMEPLSVGIHAGERADVRLGDRVAVLGAGPIGLMAMQVALAMGASEVMITDVVDFRLKKAMDLGASEAINVRRDSIDSYASSFDKVIQASKAPEAFTQAMKLVDRRGRICHVGLLSVEEVPVDLNLITTREFDIVGSFVYVYDYPRAISMVNSGKVKLAPLVSIHFSLDEVEKALRYPKEHPDSCIKTMVTF